MRILFVTPYFPPEIGAPQTRIYEQAVRFTEKGHSVSVLTTFPSYPSGIVPKEWKGYLFWKDSDRGLNVYRFWTYAAANSGFFKRILSQMSFAIGACFAGLWTPSTDVIVVESPPLFNCIPAILLSWLKRAPYVAHVSDLWPEAAIQLGVLRNSVLIWLSRYLESVFYQEAAMVLAVTSGIRNSIAVHVGPSKVTMLRNAVDTDFFHPDVDGTDLRQELGIGADRFVVLHAGTIGLAQQLDVLLKTALLFQHENSNVQFVLAGDGAEREHLELTSAKLRLKNVSFVPSYPKNCMPSLLNAADCVLVSMKDLPVFHAAIPTKLLEAMACARPIVLAAGGEVEALVKESAAGLCATPGNPVSVHDAILDIQRNPVQAKAMGRCGRAHALAQFSRERRVAELESLLKLSISSRLLSVSASTSVSS